MQEISIRHDEAAGFTVVLTVPGTPAEVEGQGETLHEALFDLAEQLENEAAR